MSTRRSANWLQRSPARYTGRSPSNWTWNGSRSPAKSGSVSGSLGFLGIAHQERYGGAGAPLAQALAVIEEFARVCRPAAFQIFEANTGPAQVINYLGLKSSANAGCRTSSPVRRPWRSLFPSPTPDRPQPTCAPRPAPPATATSSPEPNGGSPTAVKPTSTSSTPASPTNPAPRGSAPSSSRRHPRPQLRSPRTAHGLPRHSLR